MSHTAVNVLSIAQKYNFVPVITGDSQAGPCPMCGGHDRFVVDADRWFCRRGKENHPQKWSGDGIDLVQLVEGVGYVAARKIVESGTFTAIPAAPAEPAAPFDLGKMRRVWEHTRSRMDRSPASKYLLSRGLSERTQETWRFGCGFQQFGNQRYDAVSVPWFNEDGRFVGLSWRLIDPPADAPRLAWQGGMKGHIYGLLFGYHTHKPGNKRLMIAEGILNSPSFAQCFGHEWNTLSPGSDTSDPDKWPMDAIRRYPLVLVWSDEPSTTLSWANAIGPGTKMMCSRSSDGVKLDANELLRRNVLYSWFTKRMQAGLAATV